MQKNHSFDKIMKSKASEMFFIRVLSSSFSFSDEDSFCSDDKESFWDFIQTKVIDSNNLEFFISFLLIGNEIVFVVKQ